MKSKVLLHPKISPRKLNPNPNPNPRDIAEETKPESISTNLSYLSFRVRTLSFRVRTLSYYSPKSSTCNLNVDVLNVDVLNVDALNVDALNL